MSKYKSKRKFGQNFLIDEAAIFAILLGLNLSKDDCLLEIGPGLGALTKHFAKIKLKQLACVEIDQDLIPSLQKILPDTAEIYCEDILKFNLTKLDVASNKIRIVGNLPYNVSTAILIYCLDNLAYIKDMNFMLQKEIVQRICAKPSSSNYGRLSVRVQVCCQASCWLDVLAESFCPVPKVQSAMIKIEPLKSPLAVDMPSLDLILRTSFSARRKHIKNSLKNLLTVAELESLAINPLLRPDAISVAEYVKIANFYKNIK